MPELSHPAYGNSPLLVAEDVCWHGTDAGNGAGISLRVEHGAIIGLAGPGQGGRVALLDCISGLRPCAAGYIRFAGGEISRLSAVRIARLGLLRVFRQARVFRRMTCLENMLACAPALHGGLLAMFACPSRAERARAAELLAFAGLHGVRDELAGRLSAAQRRQLEFAMALMGEPRMLLLDDPVGGLAAVQLAAMVERLRRANAELGIAMLVGARDAKTLFDVAEYIYCLQQGRLVAAGTPEELAAHPPA